MTTHSGVLTAHGGKMISVTALCEFPPPTSLLPDVFQFAFWAFNCWLSTRGHMRRLNRFRVTSFYFANVLQLPLIPDEWPLLNATC